MSNYTSFVASCLLKQIEALVDGKGYISKSGRNNILEHFNVIKPIINNYESVQNKLNNFKLKFIQNTMI